MCEMKSQITLTIVFTSPYSDFLAGGVLQSIANKVLKKYGIDFAMHRNFFLSHARVLCIYSLMCPLYMV